MIPNMASKRLSPWFFHSPDKKQFRLKNQILGRNISFFVGKNMREKEGRKIASKLSFDDP